MRRFLRRVSTASAKIAPGTQNIRASTGIELQVMMPVVNAPFRLYWAYNPNLSRAILQPPVVVDRSLFPNQRDIPEFDRVSLASASPVLSKSASTFRFSIGRTFMIVCRVC